MKFKVYFMIILLFFLINAFDLVKQDQLPIYFIHNKQEQNMKSQKNKDEGLSMSKIKKTSQKDMQSNISLADIYKELENNLNSKQFLIHQYFVQLKKKVQEIITKKKQRSKSINRLADIRSKQHNLIQAFQKDNNYFFFKYKIIENIKEELEVTSKKQGELYWLLLDFVTFLKNYYQKFKKTIKKQSFIFQIKDYLVEKISKSKISEENYSSNQHVNQIETVTSATQNLTHNDCLKYFGEALMLWLIFMYQILLYIYESSFKILDQYEANGQKIHSSNTFKFQCIQLLLNCITNHKQYLLIFEGLTERLHNEVKQNKQSKIKNDFIKKQSSVSSKKQSIQTFEVKKLMIYIKDLFNQQKQGKLTLRNRVLKFYQFICMLYNQCFQCSIRRKWNFFRQEKQVIFEQIVLELILKFQFYSNQQQFNLYKNFSVYLMNILCFTEAYQSAFLFVLGINVRTHIQHDREEWIQNLSNYKFPKIKNNSYIMAPKRYHQIFQLFGIGSPQKLIRIKRPSFKQAYQKSIMKQTQNIEQFHKNPQKVQLSRLDPSLANQTFLYFYRLLKQNSTEHKNDKIES